MSDPQKILILGAGGMLGHQMLLKLMAEFPRSKVYGTVRKPKEHYQGRLPLENLLEEVDVAKPELLLQTLEKINPDVIVNCVGITLRKPDLNDMEKCIEINSMLPHRVALWAKAQGKRLIHFSTDCVFDGKKGSPYFDFDMPTADDLYGKSKFLGEVHGDHALTMRLSIVGLELESKSELVEWFLQQTNKTVKGFANTIYSGLTTLQVAAEVAKIIRDYPALNGLYQVAGPPISKYELLKLLNKYFDVRAVIEKETAHVSNKTLDCSRYAEQTGFKSPSWEEMIQEMATNKQTGRLS